MRVSYSTAYEDEGIYKNVESEIKATSEMMESMRLALQAKAADAIINDDLDNTATITGTNVNDDAAMESDEELVISKKVFRAGTRNSFIQTFHKFQEKEILLGPNSKSIQDAIMTHSAKMKFLSKRAPRNNSDNGNTSNFEN